MAWKKFTKKKTTVKTLSKRISRIAKATKPEEKTHFTLQAYSEISYSGIITQLSDIDQGTQQYERVGEWIKLKKLDVRLSVFVGTAVANANFYRFIIFKDMTTDNVGPSVTDVLNASYIGTSQGVLAAYEESYLTRFRILKDITVPLSIASGGNANKVFVMTINLHESSCHYLTNLGTDPLQGNLYLLQISSDNTVNLKPASAFEIKLTYTDA